MHQSFHMDNRARFYAHMANGDAAVFFAGSPIRKSSDDFYDFFANRNFAYLPA